MVEFVVYYTANKKKCRIEIEMEPTIQGRNIQGHDVWNHVMQLLSGKHGLNTISEIKIVSKVNDIYYK